MPHVQVQAAAGSRIFRSDDPLAVAVYLHARSDCTTNATAHQCFFCTGKARLIAWWHFGAILQLLVCSRYQNVSIPDATSFIVLCLHSTSLDL
jgi:hypothetical protein